MAHSVGGSQQVADFYLAVLRVNLAEHLSEEGYGLSVGDAGLLSSRMPGLKSPAPEMTPATRLS